MDNIKPHRGQQGSRPQGRPIGHGSGHQGGTSKQKAPKKQRHAGQRYWLVRSIGKVASKGRRTLWHQFKQTSFYNWPKKELWRRGYIIATAVLFVTSMVGTIVQPFLDSRPYKISDQARSILPTKNPQFGALLKEDTKNQKFVYNNNASTTSADAMGDSNKPRFSASFSKQPDQGVQYSDTITNVDFTIKPKFSLLQPKTEDNYVMYKLARHNGMVVYTPRTASVKEDIILEHYVHDTMTFEYELDVPSDLEARSEPDGSIGIYGSSLPINGNVGTGSENDAALLDKVRKNAAKDSLLFRLPAPTVMEADKKPSKAKSHYQLEGKTLKVITEKLDQASYPLSIDPTVYIETAAKMMRGNNETNIDFDVDNELLQKSQTTGARIDSWSSTNNLSSPAWGQGTAVAGGYIYSVGGGEGSASMNSYRTQGSYTYTVPAGVTSITVKTWGGGGGGAAGSAGSGRGGHGGGGGYSKAVITVTPGETLDVLVGTGGASAAANSRGGNGGGFSALQRSGTDLLKAGGGGGGGGTQGSGVGGQGGAGGGTSGQNGAAGTGGSAGGGVGNAGTTGAGGTGGANATGGSTGAAGAANLGGDAGGSGAACNTNITSNRGGAGGTGGGGKGGTAGTCSGGGGGGGGRFGGGGSGSTTNSGNRRNGGGGGGSSLATGASQVQTVGSNQTPGNDSDADRSGAGQGGTGSTAFGSSTNGADGAVVISYSLSGATVSDNVSWARFDSSTRAIVSPNPGTGACSGWCTQSAYKLPAARRGLSLVAYNGYLYAMGGVNSGGTPQTNVYIAKLGTNGEPQLWHPTDTNTNNWVYWYSDPTMNLTNARSHFGAVAYNNRLYIMGGLTTSSTLLSTNTVQSATLSPNGRLSDWSTSGMSALGTSRYGLSAQVYNNTLYIIGGNNTFTGTPVTTVEYARLNSDGTMNGWQGTSSLASGRQTMGGSFSTIFGGYIYVAGGCGTVNASGYCTNIRSDVQLASINADGSLAPFNTMLNLTNERIGHTLIAWQGGLYRLGGCRAQNSGTGQCDGSIIDVDYGVINKTGEASTVNSSVPSGTGNCTGGNPFSCDLPGEAYIGNMLSASVVYNGYLYIMGGCTNTNNSPSNGCTTVSSNVAYQAIGSDGSLNRPATCPVGSYVDSYCIDDVNTLPGNRLASSATVFNGRIYLVGGNSAGTSDNEIDYVSINPDGSLGGAWTDQTMAGGGTALGATAVSFTYAYARANPSQASTVPGNLFIFGGCTGSAVGCSAYVDAVYKCEILPDGSIGNGTTGNDCTTSGQLQIGTVPGASGDGLAAHAGTVYANYIYLVGGLANGLTDLTTLRYAKFDNSNNVVPVTGTTWIENSTQLNTGRRRGSGFGYNGYIYVVGGYDATTGVLADIEFAKIDVSNGSVSAFSVSSVTINQRWGLTVTVSNSYAYVIGGCTVGASPGSCTARASTIQTFQIYNNESGAPVGYAGDDLFGTDRLGASSVIYNGYIYIAGGCTSSTDCTTTSNSVQYAAIDPYGDISSWSTGGNLPAARAWGQLEVSGGTLYYIGGQNNGGTAQTTVYYTSGISSGNPTWSGSAASNGLPSARTQLSAAVWNNRIYVTGGETGGTVQNTVYISPALPAGGNITAAWNSTSGAATAFNVARSGHTTVAYANNLYILGGYNGSNYLSDTQFASLGYKVGTIAQSGQTVTGTGTTFITGQVGSVLQYPDGSTATITARSSNTSITVSVSKTVASGTNYVIMDGSVGSWTYSTSLPTAVRQADGFAANGYIYLVGGRTADSTCTPRTLVAPISANTTIATGNNPTGVGAWFETNQKYTGNRYGAAVSYNNGKIYVLGGACTADDYPTVLSVTPSKQDSNVTSHTVNMPGTINSGDLLLALFTSDGNPTVSATGWTQIGTTQANGSALNTSIWARVATGSEGASQTFTTSAGEQSATQVYRIQAGTWRNSGTLTSDVNASNGVSATTQNPNPPSLDPGSWGTEKTLWIAYAGGSRYASASSYPTSYTAASYIAGGTNTNGASTASAYLQAEAASQDPGTFTMNNSQASVARTVAVRPAVPSFSYTVNNRVQKTAVYSQPQVAQYSRMIDTDTNIFPNAWLMNGLDNSVGAHWQTQYKSSYDASNVIHHQSFDDGVNGQPVTEGTSAYDNCYANSPGTNTYSNAQYVSPSLSMRLAVPSGTNGSAACIDNFPSTTVRYERFYIRFDSYGSLSANTTIASYTNEAASDTIASVRITTGGAIQLRDKNTATYTSSALAANTWHRIELAIYGDRLYLRTYEGANLNATTPTQSTSIALNNAAMDDFDRTTVGIVTSINATWGLYIDEHKASSSNWVGPLYPSWGQNTNFGDVTLGLVNQYIPKDASGNNTQFSRWHDFWITIDASQTFGYPEDVTRGPTMADLSLFFTADPNKRLRHGKTFTGGELQPLDTPCHQTSEQPNCPIP